MKKLFILTAVLALFSYGNIIEAACDLRTHVPCFSDRGVETCCPKAVGCCGDRCCERGKNSGSGQTPTPTPIPQPADPHTGWAMLTMKNNSNIDLSLSVDGAPACAALKGLQCPTQVKAGWRSFVAKKADGTVVASGYHNFRNGESYSWPVNYQEEEDFSEPADDADESKEATIVLDNQLSEGLFLYIDDEPRPRCRAEANDECQTTVIPGPHRLKARNAEGKQRTRPYNFEPGEETTWSIWE